MDLTEPSRGGRARLLRLVFGALACCSILHEICLAKNAFQQIEPKASVYEYMIEWGEPSAFSGRARNRDGCAAESFFEGVPPPLFCML